MTQPLNDTAVAAAPGRAPTPLDIDAAGAEALANVELGRGRRLPTLPGEALQENVDVIGLLTDTAMPALVADVECGQGLAAVNLALAYPRITVVGFSSDPADLPVAQENANAAGVAERVTFELLGGRQSLLARRFDVVFFFGTIQTMVGPRPALDVARAALTERGVVVLISPGAAEEPQSDVTDPDDVGRGLGRVMELDPAEQVQVFFPAARVLWCPPPSQLEPGLSDQRGKFRSPAETRAWLRRRVEVAADGLGSIGTHEGPDL